MRSVLLILSVVYALLGATTSHAQGAASPSIKPNSKNCELFSVRHLGNKDGSSGLEIVDAEPVEIRSENECIALVRSLACKVANKGGVCDPKQKLEVKYIFNDKASTLRIP